MTREELEALVRERAEFRCEYCLMHQDLQGATFHLEHVIPITKGGKTEMENLALACPSCNLHKSDRVEVTDSETGKEIRLFDPRTASWKDHFAWSGYQIVGKTATGRATIEALDLNHPRRQRIRQAEEMFGWFPPAPTNVEN
jgi:hypothetical protein